MGLVEQPVPRSYHLQDNDWTPLSQNLCWKATIYPFIVFTRCDRLRPNTQFDRLSGTLNVKSSVDDFDIELGIVRARVGLSYDPLRLSLCSGDLWFHRKLRAFWRPPPLSSTQTPKPKTNNALASNSKQQNKPLITSYQHLKLLDNVAYCLYRQYCHSLLFSCYLYW